MSAKWFFCVSMLVMAFCTGGQAQSVRVEFSDGTAHVTDLSEGAAGVVQDGAMVDIAVSAANVQIIASGTATNARLGVSGNYDTHVILNGVNLTGDGAAVLNLAGSKTYTIMLAKDTANFLTDGSANSEKGILLSTGPLTFTGMGALTVTGNGTKVHGINSTKGGILMDGGDICVQQAGNDAMHAKVDVVINNGTLSLIQAAGDGVDCDGNITINGGSVFVDTAATDVKGLKCGGKLTLNNGLVNMTIAGDQTKGIKCAGIDINGGVQIYNLSGGVYLEPLTSITTNGSAITTNHYMDPSYCTAIKCDDDLVITGGHIFITHSGVAGKGISIDGHITITDGELDIFTSGGCSEKHTNDVFELDVAASDGLKADGNLTITGGKLKVISTGSAGDAISCDGIMVIGGSGQSIQPDITAETRGRFISAAPARMPTMPTPRPSRPAATWWCMADGYIFKPKMMAAKVWRARPT